MKRSPTRSESPPNYQLTKDGLAWIGPNGDLLKVDAERRLLEPAIINGVRWAAGAIVPYTPEQWERIVKALEREKEARHKRTQPFLGADQMRIVAEEMAAIHGQVVDSTEQLELTA